MRVDDSNSRLVCFSIGERNASHYVYDYLTGNKTMEEDSSLPFILLIHQLQQGR